ncbi:unnamed protein product [Caenorhabditis sp. 36 PRJEB53466]|nr:unnamed protein product [Caenorhabditis sp. 36 PRJEB53466]
MLIAIVFLGLLGGTFAQKLCPGNATPFDYQVCNPDDRSECPSGFTCRLSTDNSTGSTLYLCCESGRMTISDWYSEKQLTPNILPQAPYSLIQTVQLSPASSILNFPPIHVGDELVVLSFPSYITGIVQSVSLASTLNPGYVHVVTVVDPLYKPFAVLLNYNIIVGQPSQTINVTSSQRFIAYLDSSASMPKQDSYRSEYIVLVYYTASPVNFEGTLPQDMILGSSCFDTTCLFNSSSFSSKLSQPLAGTIFYLTTKNTVFATDASLLSSTNFSNAPQLLLPALTCSLSAKVSGDVGVEGVETDVSVATADPSILNIPTINWDDILKNIPTIPPIVLPTLDPNFWKNLPTIPPIQIPTLDPDFWKNLPTIPPIQIPTLDPNFWNNLPTLPPLPTLDANFWQNLPTFPTIPPFVFPTPTPKTAQCTFILGQEIQNNSTFETNLNYTNVREVVNGLIAESAYLCTGFQTQKLTDLSNKYQVLISDTQQIVSYLTTAELKSLLLAVLNGDSGPVFQLFLSKSLANLANPDVSAKLSKVSSQLSLLQLDLALSPI